jgi:hypothetical protein
MIAPERDPLEDLQSGREYEPDMKVGGSSRA